MGSTVRAIRGANALLLDSASNQCLREQGYRLASQRLIQG
jgi:hypothetical protein